MLIPVIAFDVTDFSNGNSESYLVPNTEDNYELIAGQRNTRHIVFDSLFDFQAEKEFRFPKFIRVGNAFFEALDNFQDSDEFDGDDEMTGASYLV